MKNSEIVHRQDMLEGERKGSVEAIWDLIERFVVPLRGDFYETLDSENNVDWHRREIWDATAVFGCQSLAASLQGNLTSPSQKWFDLRFRTNQLNDKDELVEWLDEVSDRLYNALNEANFDIEIAEAYMDLVAYGTSVLTEEVEDGKLVFAAIPVREIYFEEDHNKQVYKLYRKLQWTPAQIITKFGEENVPERVKQWAEDPGGSIQRKDVIFAVYPRKDKKNADISKPLAPDQRPYGYKYILKDGQETLGEEGGYYEMPAFISRWRKAAGSKWGHSPATIGMGDILTLNQIKEATLEAAGKAIDPATLTEQQNLIGDLDLDRGGLTVVTDINGMKPYESGTKFDVSNLEIKMLTEAIQKYFFQDQLQLKESPQMTATEVNVRYELMQRLLGPTFGRLKTDLLDPLIQRTFNILLREGLLPKTPEGLQEADLDIEYNGPLPRAQQADTAAAIERWMQGIGQIAEIFPEALDIVDTDKAVKEIAQLRGVPAIAMRGEDEIEKMRSERAQQQQQAQQMAMMEQTGKGMEAMGKGGQAMGEVPPEVAEAMQKMS